MTVDNITIAFLFMVWLFLTSVFLGYLFWPRCRHQWGKGEVKEYPPAIGQGDFEVRGSPTAILKLKQSHTTYVQRCTKCGLEKYHTESRPSEGGT